MRIRTVDSRFRAGLDIASSVGLEAKRPGDAWEDAWEVANAEAADEATGIIAKGD